MAALGSEVTGAWLQVSGVAISFMLLLLLTVFLTALCSQCSRRSFELGDSEEDRNPSALIRVVKLEEVAKENPIIDEIQRDETEENIVPPWRSHLGALQHQDVPTNGSTAATAAGSDSDTTAEPPPPAWRNHLVASPSSDPQSSAHTHQISSTRVDVPAPRTNEEPDEEGGRRQGR